MQTILDELRLDDGTPLRVVQVEPPDETWRPVVSELLSHKPRPYDWHIECAFQGACGALQTRFTLGLLGDRAVCNIMTVERDGVGILGHVYTWPGERQRGIAKRVLARHLEDFRLRGGKVLVLGTAEGGHAAKLYADYGFRPVPGGPGGLMRWVNPADPNFEKAYFGDPISFPVRGDWSHWPGIALLGARSTGIGIRSVALGLRGVGLLENAWCAWMARSYRNPDAQGMVLENGAGAVVAVATRVPDARWMNDIHLLDIFAHEDVTSDALTALTEPLVDSNRRTQAIADPRDFAKIDVLNRLGFNREAVLPRQVRQDGILRDLWVYGIG
ncbi:MAG: GNAT family N-acetyltransferase [Armatimonadota bacterium]